MLFDVFCCHSVQFHQGMQETSGPCTIRPAAGPETKSSRMAPRHIGLATKRQGASRNGKWWEMMGNFENGITGTTAQRFKLCLMCAPRCLFFFALWICCHCSDQIWGGRTYVSTFQNVIQGTTGSSGESLSSKTWQVDARWCQVMPGVRCTVSWLRASRCRSVPKWPKLPAPLSASQCSGFRRGHIGFCGGGIYFALSPQAQHDSMHDEKISKGSSQLFPFIFDP